MTICLFVLSVYLCCSHSFSVWGGLQALLSRRCFVVFFLFLFPSTFECSLCHKVEGQQNPSNVIKGKVFAFRYNRHYYRMYSAGLNIMHRVKRYPQLNSPKQVYFTVMHQCKKKKLNHQQVFAFCVHSIMFQSTTS